MDMPDSQRRYSDRSRAVIVRRRRSIGDGAGRGGYPGKHLTTTN